jgi:hypothetical protein
VDNYHAPSQSVPIHSVDLSVPIRSVGQSIPTRNVDSRPQVHHAVRPDYGSIQPNRSSNSWQQASQLEEGTRHDHTGSETEDKTEGKTEGETEGKTGGERRGFIKWICTAISKVASAVVRFFGFKK